MDRLLFGDNQFFGVNHMSEEKARAQAMRFQDTQAIIDVLDTAYDEGIRTFMCTTHDRIAEIAAHVRANPARYRDFLFYPCMPYAHKYANAMTDYGMLGAVKRFLPDEGLLDAAMRGGMSLAKKDIEGVTTLLIDAEMKMFQGLKTPVVFLQNVVADFLLGLGFKEAFRIFASHIRSRYDAEPGFITMNLPMLLDVLDEGWDYRYRVYGSAIAERLGRDYTGRRTSDIARLSFTGAFYIAAYRAVIARRAPLFTVSPSPRYVAAVDWSRVTLPLVDGEGAITRLLVGNVPGDWRAASAPMPPRGD